MKNTYIILIIFIFFSGLTINAKAKKKGGLFLEVFYGQSFVNLSDLNSYPRYNTEYYNYYYDYYGGVYNNPYSNATSNGIDGEFNELKVNNLFGGRLKYYFASKNEIPKFAVSLSFKYLDGTADSNAELKYDIDNFYSGPYILTRKTDPFRIYTEGYIPQIGLHYSLLNNKTFTLETFISAGLIFASVGSFERYNYNKTESTGYVDRMEIIQEYKGNGTGISMDAGIKIETNIFKNTGFFIELGYTYQKISKISGDALYKRSDRDNNSDGNSLQYNWSGDWVIVEGSFGGKHNIYHSGLDQNSVSEFNLDLSGLYLKLGFSIKIF